MNDFPKIIQRNGMLGKDGRGGRPCETRGLLSRWTNAITGIDAERKIMFERKTSHEPIKNPYCYVDYVRNTDSIPSPSIKELYMPQTINEYKAFLSVNMGNSMLSDIIQKIYNAI